MPDRVEIERQKMRDRLKQRPAPDDHHEHNGHAHANGKPKAKHRKAADRFREMNVFVDCMMADLSRSEMATWFVLFRDARNGIAKTSINDISKRTGTSRQHVVKAIGKLIDRGLIEQAYRGGLNRGASWYRVHPQPMKDKPTGHP